MKQRLFIFFALIFLVVTLVGLNAASYVQQEKLPDSEFNPNRSTYNVGATGTRAFYDLLAETGRKVARWQEPPSALLLAKGKSAPSVFVVVGEVKREFEANEIKQLLEWVSAGGKLVIIDRLPNKDLIATTANWSVSSVPGELPFVGGVDPSDQKQMTDQVIAAKPIQPTVYTANINAVQPSRYAASVGIERFSDEGNYPKTQNPVAKPTPLPTFSDAKNEKYEPPPKTFPSPPNNSSAKPIGGESENGIGTSEAPPSPIIDETYDVPLEVFALTAPVIHLANDKKNLLVDFPFGSGKIVFLTDPYIVSNGGIGLVDNAQLAVNVVASTDGIIAFDEYHQGYGSNNNRLLSYFAGTPVLAILLQFAVLAGLIFYSQSRRFACPLPEDEPNRLSKLEYVAAMAELQRTRGYDLAIENIYTDFRRRVSRSFGVDNYTITRKELANMIAERVKIDRNEIEDLMFKCEEIIYGEKTNKKEVLRITARLREIEEKLGLKRQKPARK